MTILTLVGNSIRHAYLRPRADFGVDVTLTAFLGLFAIEIALLSLKEPGYWGSVFMAFDVLGAASIVLDVPWLQGGRGSPLVAVWKSTSGTPCPAKTSNLSISIKSKSIRLIFGRINCSRRVLEAQPKSLVRTVRLRSH